MSARTWWSARTGSKPAEKSTDRAAETPDLPMDELLDARFDDEGRLAHLGRGNRQRIAERLDPRPAQTSTDELDLAVQKLSEGLEAIERQSRTARSPSAAEPTTVKSGWVANSTSKAVRTTSWSSTTTMRIAVTGWLPSSAGRPREGTRRPVRGRP